MAYHERRVISVPGRATLAEAVSMDHDWGLPFSAVDLLIEALGPMSDEDLEGAYMLAHHLKEAVACVQMRRDAEKRS